MYSATNLSFLLLAIFVAFVGAAPTRRQPRLLTLPIRSLQDDTIRDLHPQLVRYHPAGLMTIADLVVTQHLQQHINRAERRHARMSGRTEPSDEELSARLHKRMYMVGDAPIKTGRLPRDKTLPKRYNPATEMLSNFRQKLSKLTPSQLKAATSPVFAVNETGIGGVGSSNINAAAAGTLTPANAPTAPNSLGLSIEAIDVGCELFTVHLYTND